MVNGQFSSDTPPLVSRRQKNLARLRRRRRREKAAERARAKMIEAERKKKEEERLKKVGLINANPRVSKSHGKCCSFLLNG